MAKSSRSRNRFVAEFESRLADMKIWSTMQRWRGILLRVGMDALIVVLAMLLAYLLRFEFTIPPDRMATLWRSLVLVLGLKIPILLMFPVYRYSWRSIGLRELSLTGLACLTSSGAVATLELMIRDIHSWVSIPRSILVIDFGICLLAMLGVRIVRRLIIDTWSRSRKRGKKTLVIGAGEAGVELIRALEQDDAYAVVGLLDDDPAKKGLWVRGVRVGGSRADFAREKERLQVVCVLIAMPSAPAHVIRDTIDVVRQEGIEEIKIIPRLSELYSGIVTTSVLRDVRPADVLQRDPVHVDSKGITGYVSGRTVLVTGASGSIGSELCRQALGFGAVRLVALDFNETGLFYLEADLRQRFPDRDIQVMVGDVRDAEQMSRILEREKPRVVYHAAAYKHVPMMEAFPCEAIKTNVRGTRNVLHAACAAGVDAFVLISTDKAVNPTSVMGVSKRIAELVVRRQEKGKTRCLAVRFGNVLGSRGSVLKTFQDQVEARRPITLTHPDMERFFMVISEAVQLVLQASVIGQSGQVLVLDMGKPVRILDLARDVIRFYGLEPDVDLPIIHTGIRPGEKLYEELFTEEEGAEKTAHERLTIAHLENPSDEWNAALGQLEQAALNEQSEDVRRLLRVIVPRYTPPESA